jgi:hypothetical protein
MLVITTTDLINTSLSVRGFSYKTTVKVHLEFIISYLIKNGPKKVLEIGAQ